MEHIIPQSHKQLLQRILEELIKMNDTDDPTFVEYQDPPEPEETAPVLGGPIQ